MLSILTAFLVSLPPVQTRLVVWATDFLEKKLDTKIELGEVAVGLPVQAVLKDVVIYDREDSVALRMKALRLDLLTFSIWNYLSEKNGLERLTISQIELISPEFNLYKSQKDSVSNIAFFFEKKNDKPSKQGILELHFPEIHLVNGTFTFRDQTDSLATAVFPGHVNFKNLRFEKLNGELGILISPGGKLNFDIERLSLTEPQAGLKVNKLKTGLKVDTLHRFFRARNCYEEWSYVHFDALQLDAGQTHLKGNLTFFKNDLGSLLDMEVDKPFRLMLNVSSLDFGTLNYFLPNDLPLAGVVTARGLIEGNFDQIRSRQLSLRYLDNTQINGSILLTDMGDPEEMELDITLEESELSFTELQALLPNVPFPDMLKRIGAFSLDGTFEGNYYDFLTDVVIDTRYGHIISNMDMVLPAYHHKKLKYKGYVNTTNLNVDQLGISPSKLSSRLNFNGNVQGEGTEISNFNSRFDATIRDSDLAGYQIDSLVGNVVVKDRQLFGPVVLLDPQGNANVFVDIDLAHQPSLVKIDGFVRNIDLQHYGALDLPVTISSDIDIDIEGDSLDNFQGDMRLLETRLVQASGDSSLVFDIPNFNLYSERDGKGVRFLDLESSLGDVFLQGDFGIKKAAALTQRLLLESRLYFANDDSATQAYYTEKRQKSLPDSLNVDFIVLTKDSLNEAFRFLKIPLYLHDGASAIGELEFNDIESAKISFKLDSAAFKEVILRSSIATVDFIKESRSAYTLLETKVQTYDMSIGEGMVLDSMNLRMDLSEGVLNATVYADQQGPENELNIRGTAIFEDDGRIVTTVDSAFSWVKLDKYKWAFNKDHEITFTGENIDIFNTYLYSEGQKIKAEGLISKSPDSKLNLIAENLGINLLNDFYAVKYDLDGLLNINVSIAEVIGTPKITAKGEIDDFKLDEYPYGDILLESLWDKPNKRVKIDGSLVHKDASKIRLVGFYKLDDEGSPLDFELVTEGRFPLDYISPFVEGQLYGIEGRVGLEDFTITGSFDELKVLGTGELSSAEFGVEMFKTKYYFDGKVRFLEDHIAFDRILLHDQEHQTAEFFGSIHHHGFNDFSFDLQLEQAQNFLVMNTTKKDNPLFYGKVYIADGVADVTGDLDKLVVTAFVVSGARSVLKIPLEDDIAIERPDYIRFVGDGDLSQRTVETGLKGFELNLTVQATEDAQVEMIFDEKVGDIMKGRGEGTITVKINQEGEFTMSGDYEIRSGEYLFTAQNVVNKRFLVKSGGHITWTGDPYEAIMDLEAFYPLNADIKDLIGADQSLRVPVNVIMNLDGSLLSPEITLDIEIANLNESDALQIANYLASITYDAQELNKQVFSLMVFKRFARAGGDAPQGLANDGVTSSISELLSNQLNYWLSQALGDNLNVGVGTDDFTDINLLVSAKLFNDRVTIERDGTLVSANSNFSVGNISVIIRLLPPTDSTGTSSSARNRSELVLEVFNRESINVSNELTNQTGLGLFYKKDFDSLKDLFRKK